MERHAPAGRFLRDWFSKYPKHFKLRTPRPCVCRPPCRQRVSGGVEDSRVAVSVTSTPPVVSGQTQLLTEAGVGHFTDLKVKRRPGSATRPQTTHTRTHTHAHTHTHTYTHTLSLPLVFLVRFDKHTQTHTCTQIHTQMHTRTHRGTVQEHHTASLAPPRTFPSRELSTYMHPPLSLCHPRPHTHALAPSQVRGTPGAYNISFRAAVRDRTLPPLVMQVWGVCMCVCVCVSAHAQHRHRTAGTGTGGC